MKLILTHFKTYIFRGILVCIPIALCVMVLKIFYEVMDKNINAIMEKLIGFRISGLGIIIIAFILYLIGYLTSNIVGKSVINLIEKLTKRIPVISTTYQIGKQLSSTLSLPEKKLFKKVVLVEYFRRDSWVVGFVTGEIFEQERNERYLKVFIPTVPNPTSGILVLVRESKARNVGWSLEEAMKIVISGGIIGPESIGKE